MSRMLRPLPSPLPILAFLLAAFLTASDLTAQGLRPLAVSLPNGGGGTIPVAQHRGYPAVAAVSMDGLGWSHSTLGGGGEVTLRHRTGLTLRFTPGSPFFAWEDRLLQMVHAPYWFGETFHIPLQLLVDLLPGLLPNAYRFDSERFLLAVEGAVDLTQSAPAPTEAVGARPPDGAASRVVVIDAGHGGGDPGAIGPTGLREKDVALAIAVALRAELASDPSIEAYLTRDRDVEVPIWSRGEWATEWKGERPGIFISIHANALPDRPAVRGFETYFLSEARDEHERRVAALENAPIGTPTTGAVSLSDDPLLGAILRDLVNFDHQHWSADLAEEVQRELRRFHPGPDRGVKQGPFAVITNAMMPSVLVEVGFITNADEERLLARPEFHRETAAALARSIRSFFGRYPPGR
jgi:N-acetylmuramoyl-L-alanine amidase